MRLIIATCLVLLSTASLAGTFPSQWKWRQIETAHFKIIFPDHAREAGEAYARAAERSWAVLSPIFQEAPPTPIPILISDNSDLANGSATFLPYALIIAYPVLPEPETSIADYEDWAYELIVHELAHLYSFTPAHGFYTPFKYVFGSIVHPGGVLPRWYLEGLAVEVETRYSNFGRLRAPSTMATLRAITLGDAWKKENLATINESSIPTWPYGSRPYVFGSLLWQDLVKEKGPGIMNDLTWRFGGRLPFLIQAPVEEATGRNWTQRLNDLFQHLESESRSQINTIKAAGAMPQTVLSATGEQVFSATISPDGKHLAYITTSPFRAGEIRLRTREKDGESFFNRKSRNLTQTRASTGLAWLNDSSGLIFDQLNLVDRRLRLRDLYLVSVKDGRIKRLTTGARASQPTLSHDGKKVAFVSNYSGGNDLKILDLQSRALSTAYHATQGLRLSTPEFLLDGSLLFVGRGRNGLEKIYRLPAPNQKPKAFANLNGSITQVRRTPLGLLVASTQTGTGNLHLLNLDGSRKSVLTNSLTQIQQGDIDWQRSEVLMTQLTNQGQELVATPLKSYHPPLLSTLPQLQYPQSTGIPTLPADFSATEYDYSPWRHLVPSYWIPFIYPVEGGIIFQGVTATQDPTGRHAYAVDASYDSVTNQFSYGILYNNATTPMDLSLLAAETNELTSAGGSRLTNQIYRLGSSGYFYHVSNSWRWGLAGSYTNTEATNDSYRRVGPTVGVNYLSSAKYPSSPAWGETFSTLDHTQYLPGGDQLDYGRTTASLGIRLRQGLGLPDRHSLLAQAKSVYAPDLKISQLVNLGDRTINGNYLVSLINSQYLLRGYPSGALVGRRLNILNLEYHANLWDIYSGHGTFPWFFRNLEGAVIFDAASADGAYQIPDTNRYRRVRDNTIFTSTGVEFTLNNTAAYHIPLSATLGLYYGFDKRAGGDFTTFISLGYVGHGGVDGIHSSDMDTRSRPASLAR